MLGSTITVPNSRWLLFCHMWFKRTQSLLQSFCFSGWLSLGELTGYWSWQGFCRTEANRSTKGPEWNIYSCFVDGGIIQLGKGRFNISLDLFSGIQIRKENALKQKYDHSGGSQRTWRGSRGKGTTLVLSIYLFDGYNRTWLFDPSDCFCTASLMPGGFRPAPQEDSPGWRGSSGGTEPFSVVPENQSSPSTSFKLSLILTALTI